MKARFLLFILALSGFLFSCKKSQERTPLLTTSAINSGIVDAYCSGVIYSEGDAKITEKGICWGTHTEITVLNNKVICETDEKNFTAHVQGLNPDRTYYAKAYAINEFGISYGKAVSFTTFGANFPTFYLSQYSGSSANSTTLSLQVYQQAPFTYTAGICWSKNPITSLVSTSVQVVQRANFNSVPFNNNFIVPIKDLEESTSYYASVYSSSLFGTIFTNTMIFTTTGTVNPVSFSVQSVGQTTAGCSVYVTNIDDSGIDPSTIKNVGICWSTNPSPTTADNKKEQTYPASTFFNITSLQSNSTYYLRAYITTNSKIIYGPQEKMIRTLKGTVSDVNGNVYNTVEIAGLEWMTSNYRASSFNNGTTIPMVANYNQWVNSVNSQSPAYCYFGDNPGNNVPYGKLYPKYVAQNPNFPPTGWRLPTAQEWQTLVANTSAAELCIPNGSWASPTITNAYGFSVYAAGYWDSGYAGMGSETRFWVTTLTSSITEDNTMFFSSYNNAQIVRFQSGDAQSIRFVKQ